MLCSTLPRASIVAFLITLNASMSYAAVYGPSGGVGGDAVLTDLLKENEFFLQISVRHGRRVDAIQIQKAEAISNLDGTRGNDRIIRPEGRRGGSGGTRDIIELSRGECLVAIEGFYAREKDRRNTASIFSLRLITNQNRYGPFGAAMPENINLLPNASGLFDRFSSNGKTFFRYQAEPDKEIGGFLTKSGTELDAIGVITRPKRFCR